MAKFRKIDPRIWNDEKFRSLSSNGKLVFFLLLTHPNMTSLGAMRGTLCGLAEEIKWKEKDFTKAFAEAFAKGMVMNDSEASLIALPHFIRYNPPESPNVIIAWGKSVDLLPECSLRDRVIIDAKDSIKGFSKGFHEAFEKAMPIQEQEQEQEQEKAKSVPGGEISSPTVWDIWGNIPGVTKSHRSFLGKQIKTYGEDRVAATVGELSVRRPPPADPSAFLIGMLRDNEPREEFQ